MANRIVSHETTAERKAFHGYEPVAAPYRCYVV
jgi:hypothetical protein